jgi:hypothetical protein
MDNIYFLKGKENKLESIKMIEESFSVIQEEIAKVFDTKSISFLIGSGCSSYINEEKEEIGVPTMIHLAAKFYNTTDDSSPELLNIEEKKWLLDELKIDIAKDVFNKNLEKFLEVLFSLRHYNNSVYGEIKLDKLKTFEDLSKEEKVLFMIDKTKKFILKRVLKYNDPVSDIELLKLYERFYRKLLYRNSNLSKPNIFTTNYDLYSEKSLDNLGIHYVNGFSGGINKYFNPTIFNYALAEKMDLSQNKWSVIDNFIYLYKIHGSINWIEDKSPSNKLFTIKEIQEPDIEKLEKVEAHIIYPSPIKQNASLGSPYSDLFRELQRKLMQNNTVLITMGYSFSDEHVNNLIYQAFTIPSFRLIIFLQKDNPKIKELLELNDPRIWIIGGEFAEDDKTQKLHYFVNIVNKILPDLTNDEIDIKIEQAIKTLFKREM